MLGRRRWMVERTFCWLGQYCRLSKDYAYGTASSTAMIHLMVRRLARGGVTRWQRKSP